MRDVRRVRMRWDGHRLTADAYVEVDPALTLDRAGDIAHRAEHRLIDSVPGLTVADVRPLPSRTPEPGNLTIVIGPGTRTRT